MRTRAHRAAAPSRTDDGETAEEMRARHARDYPGEPFCHIWTDEWDMWMPQGDAGYVRDRKEAGSWPKPLALRLAELNPLLHVLEITRAH